MRLADVFVAYSEQRLSSRYHVGALDWIMNMFKSRDTELKRTYDNARVFHSFSDNCAAQYRCRRHFLDISKFKHKFDINCIHTFASPHHFKGQHDGFGRDERKHAHDYATTNLESKLLPNFASVFDINVKHRRFGKVHESQSKPSTNKYAVRTFRHLLLSNEPKHKDMPEPDAEVPASAAEAITESFPHVYPYSSFVKYDSGAYRRCRVVQGVSSPSALTLPCTRGVWPVPPPAVLELVVSEVKGQSMYTQFACFEDTDGPGQLGDTRTQFTLHMREFGCRCSGCKSDLKWKVFNSEKSTCKLKDIVGEWTKTQIENNKESVSASVATEEDWVELYKNLKAGDPVAVIADMRCEETGSSDDEEDEEEEDEEGGDHTSAPRPREVEMIKDMADFWIAVVMQKPELRKRRKTKDDGEKHQVFPQLKVQWYECMEDHGDRRFIAELVDGRPRVDSIKFDSLLFTPGLTCRKLRTRRGDDRPVIEFTPDAFSIITKAARDEYAVSVSPYIDVDEGIMQHAVDPEELDDDEEDGEESVEDA